MLILKHTKLPQRRLGMNVSNMTRKGMLYNKASFQNFNEREN